MRTTILTGDFCNWEAKIRRTTARQKGNLIKLKQARVSDSAAVSSLVGRSVGPRMRNSD